MSVRSIGLAFAALLCLSTVACGDEVATPNDSGGSSTEDVSEPQLDCGGDDEGAVAVDAQSFLSATPQKALDSFLAQGSVPDLPSADYELARNDGTTGVFVSEDSRAIVNVRSDGSGWAVNGVLRCVG